ncbi:hypothetical protein C8J57DRAFT_1516081 [Mycena rebaudengoi]|nr:hypothetical protein C8J57DRAFT_1516081 [Mycena rebaudengoi]
MSLKRAQLVLDVPAFHHDSTPWDFSRPPPDLRRAGAAHIVVNPPHHCLDARCRLRNYFRFLVSASSRSAAFDFGVLCLASPARWRRTVQFTLFPILPPQSRCAQLPSFGFSFRSDGSLWVGFLIPRRPRREAPPSTLLLLFFVPLMRWRRSLYFEPSPPPSRHAPRAPEVFVGFLCPREPDLSSPTSPQPAAPPSLSLSSFHLPWRRAALLTLFPILPTTFSTRAADLDFLFQFSPPHGWLHSVLASRSAVSSLPRPRVPPRRH